MTVVDLKSIVDLGHSALHLAREGMADAYGTNCILTAHGFPAQARVQQMRTSVPWQLQDTALQVSRSVSVHGLCAAHRSGKPTGHRDLLAGDAAPSCILPAFDTRFPGAPWPMPTRTGTGASTPTSLRCSLATPASYTVKTTSEYNSKRPRMSSIPAPSIGVFRCFRGPDSVSAKPPSSFTR